MASVDYWAIATITVFTSFFAGIGQELVKIVVNYIRKLRKLKKGKKGLEEDSNDSD